MSLSLNHIAEAPFQIAFNPHCFLSKWMARQNMKFWRSWTLGKYAIGFNITCNGKVSMTTPNPAPGSPPRMLSMQRC